jgi:uncharacterized protein (DUF2267 family)
MPLSPSSVSKRGLLNLAGRVRRKECDVEAIAMSNPNPFEKTYRKSEDWLTDLCDELSWNDRHKAYRALRVTLHALRDRLPMEEAVQLGAQLPMLIRGLYYEGWRPSATPNKDLDRAALLAAVRNAFEDDPIFNSKKAVMAVFRLLESHISEGESRDIAAVLPDKLRLLWREAVAV